MSQKKTSSKSARNRTLLFSGVGAALLAGVGAGIYLMRKRRNGGASALSTLPANPTEDVFGNRGDENMVEPLTLREDEILMRDRLNPYNGLY